MGFAAVLKKIPLFVRLSNKKIIKIGGKQYRTRGFFVNELAARESIVESEPWLDIVYRAALASQKGFFLDVGANIGQFGREARAAGYKGPIVSFEPIPEACEQLHRTAAKAGVWIIRPHALGDTDGSLKLNVMASADF